MLLKQTDNKWDYRKEVSKIIITTAIIKHLIFKKSFKNFKIFYFKAIQLQFVLSLSWKIKSNSNFISVYFSEWKKILNWKLKKSLFFTIPPGSSHYFQISSEIVSSPYFHLKRYFNKYISIRIKRSFSEIAFVFLYLGWEKFKQDYFFYLPNYPDKLILKIVYNLPYVYSLLYQMRIEPS